MYILPNGEMLTNHDMPIWGALVVLLLILGFLQVAVAQKVEAYYQNFLLGLTNKGKWAKERAEVKSWNDKIRKYCAERELEIVLQKPLRFPTSLRDMCDNY